MFHARRQLISAVQPRFVAASGGWTPASASPAFWFDADNAGSITQVGGAVSQWNDLSVNGRHATQSTGSQKFTYTTGVQNGKPGLLSVYANSSLMTTGAFTQAQPFIIAIAFKMAANFSNWCTLFDASISGAGSRAQIINGAGDGVNSVVICAPSTLIGGAAYTFPAEISPEPYYIVATFNGASSEVRQNGVRIGTGNPGTGGISGVALNSVNTPQSLPGYFLEAFCIPGSSSTDVSNAETYIANKWAILGPTIDGSAAGSATATTCTATLSTSKTNDIIFVSFKYDGGTISSVSDTAGLTWTLVANQTANGFPLAMYYAKSTGILTSDVITVTMSTSTLIEMHAFGVAFANFTTPFDTNGSLPTVEATVGTFVTLTTSNANDLLIATYRHTSAAPTIGLSGWSTVRGGENNITTLFKVVTSTQSALQAIANLGGTQKTGIATALVRTP